MNLSELSAKGKAAFSAREELEKVTAIADDAGLFLTPLYHFSEPAYMLWRMEGLEPHCVFQLRNGVPVLIETDGMTGVEAYLMVRELAEL